MAEKILVPTDGSRASMHAVEYSAGLAKAQDAELIILNVISTNIAKSYHGVSAKDKIDEELEKQAKRIVDKGIGKAKKAGVKARGLIKKGLPDKEIIKCAGKDPEIIMVVMGAFGKNFLERKIIGSKTERVVRDIAKMEIPLVVVPCPQCLS